MNRNALIMFTLLALLVVGAQFTSLSFANMFPDPGPDLPRIYIRSNGNVEPETASIQRVGNTYELTGNIILYTIEIQRDNIVLDGKGHTILGNASRIKGYDDGNNGVVIANRYNISITRLNFDQGDTGVRVSDSSIINIVNNRFSDRLTRGIEVKDSSIVLIEDNIFANIAHDPPSISLSGTKSTIKNNTITGSIRGIRIQGSANVISDNKIQSVLPIIMEKANFTEIARNIITGPDYQNFIGSEGIALFTRCTNNVISSNNLTGFSSQAIRLVFACSNNTVYGNYFANNEFAITLQERATDNTFYGNTLTADSCNVSIINAQDNFWDNGTIGNYWGNYHGLDRNGDGIGDTPYEVNGLRWDQNAGGFVSFFAGQDNYPLMGTYDVDHHTIVVQHSEPFLFVLVAITVLAVVGTGFLVYFKKRKREVKS